MSHPAQMIFVESVKQNYVNLFIRKKVLEVGPNDDVTYFVLQRYLSKHFIKTPAVVAAV